MGRRVARMPLMKQSWRPPPDTIPFLEYIILDGGRRSGSASHGHRSVVRHVIGFGGQRHQLEGVIALEIAGEIALAVEMHH